jgi:hypothetical protein
MNSTNRILNRAFLVVVGIALLAAGTAAVAVAVLPAGPGVWRTATTSVGDSVLGAWRADLPAIGLPHTPWMLAAVPAGALVLVVVLFAFVFAQGGGRRSGVVESEPVSATPVAGAVTVDAAVARDILQRSTESIRGVSRVTVSVYRVARRPALKLTVSLRAAAGAEPASVLPAVETAVTEWDRMFGRRLPVFVHLTGTRVTRAAPSRVL